MALAYDVRAYISILAHSEMMRLEIELTILWIQFTSAGCLSLHIALFPFGAIPHAAFQVSTAVNGTIKHLLVPCFLHYTEKRFFGVE